MLFNLSDCYRNTCRVFDQLIKRLLIYLTGMEIVGPTKRSWAGLVFEFFWAAGAMILALAAYLIRDWRHLNLVMSVPPVLFLSYIW